MTTIHYRCLALVEGAEDLEPKTVVLAKRHGVDGFVVPEAALLRMDRGHLPSFAIRWTGAAPATPSSISRFLQLTTDEHSVRINQRPLVVIDHQALLGDPNVATTWRTVGRRHHLELTILATRPPTADQFDDLDGVITLPGTTASTAVETMATSLAIPLGPDELRQFSLVSPALPSGPIAPRQYEAWVHATLRRDFHRAAQQLTNEVVLFTDQHVLVASFLDAHDQATLRSLEQAPPVADTTSGMTAAVRPALSAVVVTQGEPDSLMASLQSVLDTCRNLGPVQLVVIDHGSTDDTATVLRGLADNITSQRTDASTTIEAAYRTALALTTSDHVLLLGQGIAVPAGWHEQARLVLDGTEVPGVVGVARPDGSRAASAEGSPLADGALCLLVRAPVDIEAIADLPLRTISVPHADASTGAAPEDATSR